MRWISRVVVLSWIPLGFQSPPRSYWLLAKEDGRTWCGYEQEALFKRAADSLKPTESARVTFRSDSLTEVTHQVESESGDWIVIDKYTPSDSGILLRRASLLTQRKLQVIQDAAIRHGKAEPFRVVRTLTLDGKVTAASGVDLPSVTVQTDLESMAFMPVVDKMRTRSVGALCDMVDAGK